MHSAAVIYLALILFFIYKNSFFGVFKDEQLSPRQFTFLFLFKALAIPVFYLVYDRFYGGSQSYDSGVFYSDAKAVNEFAKTDFKAYLQLLFGLQDDSEGFYVYNHCLVHTYNWDNGKVRDFFYNDNRVVIRLHSLLHFIAFNSYYVHALFNCFLSFIGVVYLYKALKMFFEGKELWLLAIFCFFPTLWFYTGAISKEGLALFVFGCSLYSIKRLVYGSLSYRGFLWLAGLLFISCFLKPYLLWSGVLYFGIFFVLQRSQIRHKALAFVALLCFLAVATNSGVLLTGHRSLTKVAFARQRIFADAAKGGTFLLDSNRFIRLNYDSTLVKRAGPGYYTIKKNVPFMYWEHSHQQDTLFCASNQDTIASYKLVYRLPESGSNFDLSIYSGGGAKLLAACFYYSLFYPFFYNAKGALQVIASFENLLIFFSLLLVLWGFLRKQKDHFPALAFLLFALGLCLLVGLTTPNSGAIFRYRSPAVIFILAAALYYTNFRNLKSKLLNLKSQILNLNSSVTV